MTLLCGIVQWCSAAHIVYVYIGITGKKKLNNILMAVLGSQVQRGIADHILQIYIEAA